MSAATTVTLTRLERAQRRVMRAAALLPDSMLGAASRFTKVNKAGDRLAPEMAVVGYLSSKLPQLAMTGGPVVKARRNLDASASAMAEVFAPFAIDEDLTFPGADGELGATRYRATAGDPRGLLLFIHGGGWVVGSRASHDSAARSLAVSSGCDVLSVEYRLAPENPFPAAVDDVLAAWRFAVEKAPEWGIDPNKIAVGGDSAGGNLAAVIAQQTRGQDVVPALQVLIYPAVDFSVERPSRLEFAAGHFLTREDIGLFQGHYLANPDEQFDVRASPLLGDVHGVAPAYVVVAGFDPLRDEGLAYAEKLRVAGVPVTVDRAGSMIHGFINMGLVSPGARAYAAQIGKAIAAGLSS